VAKAYPWVISLGTILACNLILAVFVARRQAAAVTVKIVEKRLEVTESSKQAVIKIALDRPAGWPIEIDIKVQPNKEARRGFPGS